MEIKLENAFKVDEPIDKVWEFLSNPEKVAPCLPGAQILEVVSDTEYKGAVKLKLGPFFSQFKGEVVVELRDHKTHEIKMVGRGKDARGTGSATMIITGKLSSLPDGGTEMTSSSHLTINGKLAQFGARMIQDVSKSMFNQFTRTFEARLKGGEAEGEPDENAVSVTEIAGAVVKGAMGRLMGKKDD